MAGGSFLGVVIKYLADNHNAYLLKKYKITLANDAYDIGSGSYGTVYKTSDPLKVLKITRDRSEAEASSNLVGKSLRYINKIYGVFYVKNYYVWGIVQDRLEHTNIPHDIIGLACDVLLDQYKAGVHDVKDAKERFMALWLYKTGEHNNDYKKFDFEKFAKFYFGSQKELKKFGIHFEDYHGGNIMQDNQGNFKLIDLGVSKSGKNKIDVLEQHYNGIAKKLKVIT